MKHVFALLLTLLASSALGTEFKIGPEFLPSYVDKHESNLIVPAGETVTFTEPQDIDAIEVHGTLRIRANLRYINLVVAPGGLLEIGTAADPILTPVEIVKKDVPLDTTFDPFQWGHGIVVYSGGFVVHGRKLDRTWGWTTQDTPAGATQVTLASPPVGWEVGDEVLIPDTRALEWTTLQKVPKVEGLRNPIRRESKVTIAAISGNTLTLSKGLDFEHNAVRKPDGTVVRFPVVANATRTIVFRSENPNEINRRGHIVAMRESHVDMRYASRIDLGRTTAEPLDNTTQNEVGVITHIGTNQIAKYGGMHFHHVHAHGVIDESHPHVGHVVGCFADGSDVAKWGEVQHGTHGVHFADNVSDRFVGSCYVSEDGNESKGHWENNLALGCIGNGKNGKFSFNGGAPGGEGAGFWFHGAKDFTVRNNVAMNSIVGFQVFYMGQLGSPDYEVRTGLPAEFKGNVAISNAQNGFESWRQPKDWIAEDFLSAHNGKNQVMAGPGELSHFAFRNLFVYSDGKTAGLHTGHPYTATAGIEGGEIRGCRVGLAGAANQSITYSGLTLQNIINADLRYTEASPMPQLSNMRYEAYEDFPLVKVLSNLDVDPGDGETPPPPPPPDEEWTPANIGPPFNGDVSLRVRNGLIEKLQQE